MSDTLSVESVDATSSKNASVTLNTDGTLTYNATSSDTLNALAEGETATDTFQYSVTDGEGGSDTGTVTVAVTGVNDGPTANPDAVTMETVQATEIDVLANATDPDTSDTLTIESFDATSQEGATITLNTDGTLHYDPTGSETLSGQSVTTDSFTYALTDGHTGVAVTGTVTVTIGELDSSGTTYIVLNGDSISTDGGGATVDGTTVTITAARTYSISGTLNDGQVIVDCDDEEDVTLLLNGADITCSANAPIYVVSAANAVITLADGTNNYVTDGTTYTYETTDTDEPDAAIFSHDDLKINGTGSLTVDANYNNGIASKDDLDILAGNITVTAVNHGIKGRDSVVMVDGDVTVNAGGDGIQSNNAEDAEKGYVTIEGGTLDITAASDGIQAETNVVINGGTVTISAGGGSSSGSTDAGKGIKAVVGIAVNGGTVTVDSADDAVHSDGIIAINSGSMTLATADDAIHSESAVTITGGTIDITTSYEGIDSPTITIDPTATIDDTTIDIVASGDGISAASLDGSSSTVSIYGGYIVINATGDGRRARLERLHHHDRWHSHRQRSHCQYERCSRLQRDPRCKWRFPRRGWKFRNGRVSRFVFQPGGTVAQIRLNPVGWHDGPHRITRRTRSPYVRTGQSLPVRCAVFGRPCVRHDLRRLLRRKFNRNGDRRLVLRWNLYGGHSAWQHCDHVA